MNCSHVVFQFNKLYDHAKCQFRPFSQDTAYLQSGPWRPLSNRAAQPTTMEDEPPEDNNAISSDVFNILDKDSNGKVTKDEFK